MSEKQNLIIPKQPFLVGDAVLVFLACFIVIASPKPMTALAVTACALSVLLGMLVYVTPYLIEHFTAQQNIKLKQVEAEETLLKAVELAYEVLSKTENVHAEVMKSVLVTKQLPSKLEESTEALSEVIISLDKSEIVSLKEKLKDITNSESFPATKDGEFLLKSLRKSITDIVKTFGTKLSDQTMLIQQLKTQVTQLKTQIVGIVAELSKDPTQDDPDESDSEKNEDNSSNQKDKHETKPTAENENSGEESTLGKEDISKTSKVSTIEEAIIENTEESSQEDSSDSDSVNRSTRLLVGAFIGISNKLFIRGEGPGLSWDKGVPMDLVGIGKWEWKTFEATQPVACKVLINDEQWTNDEDIILHPGTTVETTASF